MTITVDINSLNIEEKLRLMELLWNDLSENCEDILIPSWHRDVLKNREEIVKSNLEEIISWEEAKKNIINRGSIESKDS